jgi:phenylpropionate dioxygenase-like ring-hydroxylating dioxygenase large terminal subunit
MTTNPSLKSPFAPFDIGTGPRTPNAEILQSGRIPVKNYVSPEFYEREIEHVFTKTWLNVALTHEVKDPGSYVVKDVLGKSIVVVRGKDGVIRAFHNICSHRGTQIVWDNKGKVSNFICRYHAWAYDTKGELLRVPDEKSCFDNFDKSKAGLTAVSCDSYGPFVFITFNSHPTLTLREFLGGWATRFDDLPWEEYPLVARIWRVIDCNWKYGMDANSEGYHIPTLHARSIATQMLGKDNPFAHRMSDDFVGPHHNYVVGSNPEYMRPESDLVYAFALKQAPQLSMGKDEDVARSGAVSFANHPGINVDKLPFFTQDAFALFPNFIIQTGRQGWYTAQFFPLGHNRTLFYADYAFKRPTSLRERWAREHALMFYRDIAIEDLLNMDRQHIAHSGGGKSEMLVGNEEIMIRHHQACITAALGPRASSELCAQAAE